MLKHFTLAAVLLTATAPLAHAQDTSDDGDRYERSESDDGPRSDMGEQRDDRKDDRRMRDMRHGDRWARNSDDDGMEPMRGDRPGLRGPGWRRGPPPAPLASFEIHTAPGQFLRVECGDETLAECVDAAQPILDKVTSTPETGGASTPGETSEPAADRVPPPPESLVDTPAGDAATPPPAAATTPDAGESGAAPSTAN